MNKRKYHILYFVSFFIVTVFGCSNQLQYNTPVIVLKNIHSDNPHRMDTFNTSLFYHIKEDGLLVKFIDKHKGTSNDISFYLTNDLLKNAKNIITTDSLKDVRIFEVNQDTEAQDDNTFFYFQIIDKRWHLLYVINTDWSSSHSFVDKESDKILIDTIINFRKNLTLKPLPPR